MKLFFLISLISASSSVQSHVLGEAKSLQEVFGEIPKVPKMEPRSASNLSRRLAPAFYATRTPDNCVFPMQVLLVQDRTNSFADDYLHMRTTQLDLMHSQLTASHPNTTFGVVEFQDKPILPWGTVPTPENGYYSDKCLQFSLPSFTNNLETIREVYAKGRPNGGGDANENNFGALLAAAQSNQIKWTADSVTAKLIVHVTDGRPHFFGEGIDQQGLKNPSGVFDDATFEKQCLEEFYPSPYQTADAIKQLNAYTAHLVYDPEYLNGRVGSAWTWFNRLQNNTDDFLNLLAKDSNDFWAKLSSIIRVIEELECQPITTPVPEVTTTTSLRGTTTDDGTLSAVGPSQVVTTPSITTTITTTPTTTTTIATTSPSSCPSTTKYCKDGVYVKMGFKPAKFDFDVEA